MHVVPENPSSSSFLLKPKDPGSAISHLLGLILAVVGVIVLIKNAAVYAGPVHIIAFTVFGTSLILLYLSSSVYHYLDVSEKLTLCLRKIDHVMIYVLIAGTYTPICLLALEGIRGLVLLAILWILALAGGILTVLWLDAPRWLTTGIYIGMGWMLIVALPPLIEAISLQGLAWLLGGGLLYTIGAIFYGSKWPHIDSPYFGFHEIFHLFVLGGSFCHYYLMLAYLMYV